MLAPKGNEDMRRTWTLYAAAVTTAALMLAVPLRAHHAFTAEFDATKPVTLKGEVTKVDWINPHSWLYVDVKDPETGTVTNWKIEMGAPNQLLRRGWNTTSLPAGAQVTVEGFAAKNGSHVANGGLVTLADGRKISVSSPGTGVPGDQK
jgi:hypothetical protein